MWNKGLRRNWGGGEPWMPIEPEHQDLSYSEWAGSMPRIENYMPVWPESIRTHFQMYETTSEGTPISPVLESPEDLAGWLADNKANVFAGQTMNYEEWLAVVTDTTGC